MPNKTPGNNGIGKGKVANLPVGNAGNNKGVKVNERINDRPKFHHERQTMQVSKPKFGGGSNSNSNARMGGQSMGHSGGGGHRH
jgi:hypothetical protein